jgi:hypothetical protein
VYKCSLCELELCYKCYRSKEILDPGHPYEEIGHEYASRPSSPVTSSNLSIAGNETPFPDHIGLGSDTEEDVDNRDEDVASPSEMDVGEVDDDED